MITNSPPAINPRPRARFQTNKDFVRVHADLVKTKDFQNILDYSLLEYQAKLAEIKLNEFNAAAAAHLKMQGAMEFIDVLKKLGHQEADPVIIDRTNLDNQ